MSDDEDRRGEKSTHRRKREDTDDSVDGHSQHVATQESEFERPKKRGKVRNIHTRFFLIPLRYSSHNIIPNFIKFGWLDQNLVEFFRFETCPCAFSKPRLFCEIGFSTVPSPQILFYIHKICPNVYFPLIWHLIFWRSIRTRRAMTNFTATERLWSFAGFQRLWMLEF